jgi:26S proteasome regulatory subunit RPN2 C-terminal domain
MPRLEFRSGARPSTFAYPPPLEEKKDKSKEKVETAVLSTTARQKRKEAEKKKEEKMEVVGIFIDVLIGFKYHSLYLLDDQCFKSLRVIVIQVPQYVPVLYC